ncbi:MAG: SRPBCC domain-containing protein [Bacteroidota bacterium]
MALKTIVHKSIDIATSASKVWEALTDPALLKLWMADGEIAVSSDWKTGSDIVIKGNVNGKHEYRGTILEAKPGVLLRYNSWTRISRLPDQPENYSVVEFRLSPVETGTRLELTHSNLIAEAAFEHSNFYWGIALEVIKSTLEKP